MALISIRSLVGAGIGPTQARLFTAPLGAACARYGIDSRVRIAAFIAQCAHESADFTRLEESLWYTTPERIRVMWPTRVPSLQEAQKLVRNPEGLANRVYANRLGNGEANSGDGWRFAGRGLIQLTGRENYRRAGEAIGAPYERQPERVALPADAALTAAWYFASHGCCELADASHIDAITRKVNGAGMVAAVQRKQRFEQALAALA